jgi:hypothetical protein
MYRKQRKKEHSIITLHDLTRIASRKRFSSWISVGVRIALSTKQCTPLRDFMFVYLSYICTKDI